MLLPNVTVNTELSKWGVQESPKTLANAAARADEDGVGARTVILRGFPVKAICASAEKFAPQFVVLGSHGWGAVKRTLFGSVSTGVLHHAKCPVLVVRGEPVEDEVARSRSREAALA